MSPMANKAPLVWQTRFIDRMIVEQEHVEWSDVALGKRAGMTNATIWKIKHNDRRINIDEAYAIAAAFGYDTVDEFIHHAVSDSERALRLAIRQIVEAIPRHSDTSARHHTP